jgi:hypothetical protein
VASFDFLPRFFWQSNGKVEKFVCVVDWLHVLRESAILVSFGSMFYLSPPSRYLPGTMKEAVQITYIEGGARYLTIWV